MRGRKKEPGFRELPVPEKNDLRPGANIVFPYEDSHRKRVGMYVGPVDFVHDINSPTPGPYGVSGSPSSPRYVVGLRKTNVKGPEIKDPQPATIQTGIKRH